MMSVQNKLLVAGGIANPCAWNNPTMDAWTMGQKPLYIHKYGALAHYNGKLLLLGRSYDNGTDEVEE